jgi:hypothetical protein
MHEIATRQCAASLILNEFIIAGNKIKNRAKP